MCVACFMVLVGLLTLKLTSVLIVFAESSSSDNPLLERSFNRIPAIRVFAVRVTPIFTNKKHALNTLKMGLLLSECNASPRG
jgi:hypothetical protein